MAITPDEKENCLLNIEKVATAFKNSSNKIELKTKIQAANNRASNSSFDHEIEEKQRTLYDI